MQEIQGTGGIEFKIYDVLLSRNQLTILHFSFYFYSLLIARGIFYHIFYRICDSRVSTFYCVQAQCPQVTHPFLPIVQSALGCFCRPLSTYFSRAEVKFLLISASRRKGYLSSHLSRDIINFASFLSVVAPALRVPRFAQCISVTRNPSRK